jgi:beta-1,4-mannosyl-glycoprotein beta-1,4-N-acetylglucosaminyltransferase
MHKNKIYDCVTFFDENLLVNSRFEILKDVVDYFIVCESNYDHKGKKKKINFELKNKNFEDKVRHIIIDENFPNLNDGWEIESYQREKIITGLYDAKDNDFILYSDSDEIPNPNLLKNIILHKKYGVFMQKFFVYKINIFNKYESPWEGTRICKKKDLKSITYLRKKILCKNLKKPFWKIGTEKNIQIMENGGWHFNNLYTPELISKKLKTFQHQEFSVEKYSSVDVINEKISNLEDLFGRKHKYQEVKFDQSYPDYIINNLDKFNKFIL